jgi:hypothetical protein
MQQGPYQAPGKQAPMQQAPMQAPSKGAYYGGQTHTAGYANYNCAGCGNGGYQQQTYATTYRTNNSGNNYYARRGVFGRRWR